MSPKSNLSRLQSFFAIEAASQTKVEGKAITERKSQLEDHLRQPKQGQSVSTDAAPDAWMAMRELSNRTLTIDTQVQKISAATSTRNSDLAPREQVVGLKNAMHALRVDFKDKMIKKAPPEGLVF